MSDPSRADSERMGAELQEARELGLLADRLTAAGLLSEALIQQRAATESYRACLDRTTDPTVQTTLRMMIADHSRSARDLERRIVANGNNGRSQPRSASATVRERALPSLPTSDLRVISEESHFAAGNARSPTHVTQAMPSPPVVFDGGALFRSPTVTRPPSETPTPNQSTPTSPYTSRLIRQDPSSDEMTSEGSYMLPMAKDPPPVDPQDSVTLFLNAIEGMLDQFDQPLNLPLAFATAPLSAAAGNSTPTPTRRVPAGVSRTPKFAAVKTPVRPAQSSSETGGDDSDSDSSFYMIPSSPLSTSPAYGPASPHQYPPSASQTTSSSVSTARAASLRDENTRLSLQVQELTSQLERIQGALQAHVAKDEAMRQSVLVLRRETQRMASSTTLVPLNAGRPSLFSHMNPSLQASLLAPTPTVPLRPAAPTSPFHPNQSSIPARYHQRQASSSDSSEAGPASPRHAPPPPPPPETSRRTPKPNLSSSPPTPTPTPALAVPIPASQPSRLQRNAPSPAPPILDPAVDVHALGRIKDLEDQLQLMKNENEQQKAQLARYRDRWQKLKDNAKRKQQKLATTTASTTAAEPTTGSNDFGATGTTPPSIIHIAPPAPLPVPAPPTSSSSSPISTRSHHVRAPTSPRVSRRSAAGTVPKPLSEDED